MFLLVENYLLDRFNWSSDRLGIFGKKKLWLLILDQHETVLSLACIRINGTLGKIVFFSLLLPPWLEACREENMICRSLFSSFPGILYVVYYSILRLVIVEP